MRRLSLLLALGVVHCSTNLTRRNAVRVVIGGSLESTNPLFDLYRGFPPNSVKFITAAGTRPTSDARSIEDLFSAAGIQAEWIPVYDTNCAERTRSDEYVKMVEDASAIFLSGGQSGRLQSCMYGNYHQSGITVPDGTETPFLRALRHKAIVGGSSAGAMNQPLSEILVTGHSVESYSAVRAGSVFQRNMGNALLGSQELVDTHFSERGRQGRLVIIAMQTGQKWAFGTDENTAYLWRSGEPYEVVGASGVVVYESTSGNERQQTTTMHFLTSGDTIDPTTGEIKFNSDKQPCAQGSAPSGSSSVFSGVNYRTISIAVAKAAEGTEVTNYHGFPAVEVRMRKDSKTVAMCGPSGESFSHLSITQYQSSSFNNTEAAALPLDHMWELDE